MVSEQGADLEWGRLSELDEATRETRMLERYAALALLPEEERRTQVRSMANAEYSLPDEKLREFTLSRMRAWIALDQEQGPLIANSYDAVMQDMPAGIAMKRVSLVQTLVIAFTPEEEARLRELVPRVFAGAPNRALTALERNEGSFEVAKQTRKKAWWAFWAKG